MSGCLFHSLAIAQKERKKEEKRKLPKASLHEKHVPGMLSNSDREVRLYRNMGNMCDHVWNLHFSFTSRGFGLLS